MMAFPSLAMEKWHMEENERTDEYKVGKDKRVIELPDSPPAVRKPEKVDDDSKIGPVEGYRVPKKKKESVKKVQLHFAATKSNSTIWRNAPHRGNRVQKNGKALFDINQCFLRLKKFVRDY